MNLGSVQLLGAFFNVSILAIGWLIPEFFYDDGSVTHFHGRSTIYSRLQSHQLYFCMYMTRIK